MQRHSAFCLILGLLASPLARAAKVEASETAKSEAQQFLRSHAGSPPRGDELAELKGANPEAYAIVKALLTKRSLGLLNPSHPTASFAAPEQQEQPVERGPEVFQKFASPEELRPHQQSLAAQKVATALPYAEVQPASHHDWLNWKPQSSAMDDETMVQNVLGAVAELKGKKAGLLSKSRSEDENTLVADEQSFGAEPQQAAAPAKSVAPAATVQELSAPAEPAAPAHENSYLKSVDFGISTPASTPASKPEVAPAKHVNSYLKGIDLSGDMPMKVEDSQVMEKKPAAKSSSNNYLAAFSWDDAQPQPRAVARHTEAQVKTNGKDTNLMAWLGVVKKAPPPQAPAAPAKPANPYLADLTDAFLS